MSKERLQGTTETVKAILESDRKSRDDDNYLYYLVLKRYGQKNGVDIDSMSIPRFLLHMKDYGFPPFESVRRARQKLQHDNPELASSHRVAEIRKLEESAYRSYVRER